MPHVHLITSTAKSDRSHGYRVLTAVHVNNVQDMLKSKKEGNFQRLKTAWRGWSLQMWDPFVPVGSEAAQTASNAQGTRCKAFLHAIGTGSHVEVPYIERSDEIERGL